MYRCPHCGRTKHEDDFEEKREDMHPDGLGWYEVYTDYSCECGYEYEECEDDDF